MRLIIDVFNVGVRSGFLSGCQSYVVVQRDASSRYDCRQAAPIYMATCFLRPYTCLHVKNIENDQNRSSAASNPPQDQNAATAA